MECDDTDICLNRIVTALEHKDAKLLACLISLILILFLFFYFFIHHLVETCSVTSFYRKVWSDDENRPVEDAEEAAPIVERG